MLKLDFFMKIISLKRFMVIVMLALCGFAFTKTTFDKAAIGKFDQHDQPGDGIKALPGTYQFIRLSKVEEIFTTDAMDEILVMIEENRHETEVVFINISIYTKVKILPGNVVNAPGFVPVPEYLE